MAISEAARSDLYTGLRDVLGSERAETLMSAIPLHELDEMATEGDIAELKGDIAGLRADFKRDIAELRGELKGDIAELRADVADKIDAIRKSTTTLVLALAVTIIGAMTTLMMVALNVG